MEALRPLVLGQSLAGAGGGGFLYLLTREPRQQQAVLQVLNDTPVSDGTDQKSRASVWSHVLLNHRQLIVVYKESVNEHFVFT